MMCSQFGLLYSGRNARRSGYEGLQERGRCSVCTGSLWHVKSSPERRRCRIFSEETDNFDEQNASPSIPVSGDNTIRFCMFKVFNDCANYVISRHPMSSKTNCSNGGVCSSSLHWNPDRELIEPPRSVWGTSLSVGCSRYSTEGSIYVVRCSWWQRSTCWTSALCGCLIEKWRWTHHYRPRLRLGNLIWPDCTSSTGVKPYNPVGSYLPTSSPKPSDIHRYYRTVILCTLKVINQNWTCVALE